MNDTKQFAVFDFDGTLREGHITQSFRDRLFKENLFNRQEHSFQEKLFNQHRAGKLPYQEWTDKWAISWGRSLQGFSQDAVLAVANEVFEETKNTLFHSSHELIQFFNDRNFETLILSGGASEVIEQFSKHLGIHYSIATELEIVNGIYTGRLLSNTHTSEGKGIALQTFLKKHGVDQPTFSFGDSTGDIAILEQAKHPVALNPDKELAKIAAEKNWPTKTYDNIINYLNPNNG